MTIQERKDLLAKPCWTFKDIMLYCDCKKTKAFEIMQICRDKFNGSLMLIKHKIKRDSVLAYCNTSIEHEKYIIKQLEEENNK